ncbi:hypothetical protein BHE74_00000842 [Ensete ventricosum]|nr:hypothetical protein BHE74_00000842 [Ensete ventricosum]
MSPTQCVGAAAVVVVDVAQASGSIGIGDVTWWLPTAAQQCAFNGVPLTQRTHMATLFIAVQCCQCSMMQVGVRPFLLFSLSSLCMWLCSDHWIVLCRRRSEQVKQQKKSGNKWVCSVCNQRQSVRRIHSRGHVASDLRSFVQAFNMARADIGSHGFHPVPPRSDGPRALYPAPEAREAVAHGSPFSTTKKRTDWSEYLDPTHEEMDDDDAKEERGCAEMGGGKVAAVLQGNSGSSKWSEHLEEGDIHRLSPRGGSQPDRTRKRLFDDDAVVEEVHPDFR